MARFPISLGRRSRLVLRLWRVTPERAWADLGEEALEVRFGFAHLRVPLANVVRWRIEGPFRWITAIGIRRSVRGGDVSFCGDAHGAVRLDLRERLRWSVFRVPAIWVGVADLDGFAAALAARGIPGEDARRRRAAERPAER